MEKYKHSYLNQSKAIFQSDNQFGIPRIDPFDEEIDDCEWIGFNYALTCKDPENKVCHMFLDDYQFERLWNQPDKYIHILKRFKAVTAPDFSLYTDFPKALQIFNHFRKHWLARYYADNGVKIIPTICWSEQDSFDFCFEGEPKESTVAISDIGCGRTKKTKKLFSDGFNEMIRRINPRTIYVYTCNDISELITVSDCDIRIVSNETVKRLRRF